MSKILCSLLSICILSLHLFSKDIDCKTYVIGARGVGFFSEFFGTIQNIIWCREKGLEPVVFWNEKCCYYEPEGFLGLHNAWEYYFEPVSKAIYAPYNAIHREYSMPIGFEIPYKDFHDIENIRLKVSQVITKYIKIKPYISNIVNDFYTKYMDNSVVIGIHLRGSDKGAEADAIKPIDVINKAQEYAESVKNMTTGSSVKFLVASDEARLINFARKKLQGTVITYDGATRSTNGKPVHISDKDDKKEMGYRANLGRDVLVEVLLLARCQFFVHSQSNVSTAVIFFNPELIHFQFNGYAKIDEIID